MTRPSTQPRAGDPRADARLVDAYLDRLDLPLQRVRPSLALLMRLQHAHLAAIPYDNLAIMTGRPESIDALATVTRIGRGSPGGYCFHQNAAFAWILTQLGFRVELVTGLLWRDPDHRAAGGLLHPVPLVHDLVSPGNPGGTWWPDLGLGDGALDPLPLTEGHHASGGCTYWIERRGAGWTLHHHPLGSFAGVDLQLAALDTTEAAAVHKSLSTPPGSFTRRLVVQRPVAAGSVTLRGRVLTRIVGSEVERETVPTYAAWRNVLDDLRLITGDVSEADLRRLFDDASTATPTESQTRSQAGSQTSS